MDAGNTDRPERLALKELQRLADEASSRFSDGAIAETSSSLVAMTAVLEPLIAAVSHRWLGMADPSTDAPHPGLYL